MKSTKAIPAVILAAAALLVVTGCQTVSTSNTQYIGVQQFAPSDPMQVQILRTEPTRPHIKLGEVRAEPSSESVDVTKIETALKKAAAKMGADAAVVVYDKTQVVGAQVVGGFLNRSVETITGRVIVAVAIKYQ
jgi:hypothetical protein